LKAYRQTEVEQKATLDELTAIQMRRNELMRYIQQTHLNSQLFDFNNHLNFEGHPIPYGTSLWDKIAAPDFARQQLWALLTNHHSRNVDLRSYGEINGLSASSLLRNIPAFGSQEKNYLSAFNNPSPSWISLLNDLQEVDSKLPFWSMSSPAPPSIIIECDGKSQAHGEITKGMAEEFATPDQTPSKPASLPCRTNQKISSFKEKNSQSEVTSVAGVLPYPLYREYHDEENLSEYQCLIRKHIEVFEASKEDISSNAQGRHKTIMLGQVGIRCCHCSNLLPRSRMRGSTYYPSSLHGLYQAAQNMASIHFGNFCHILPDPLREELLKSRGKMKSNARGGKEYWAHCLRIIGITEEDGQLRLSKT
jgi:hypothetical protein